MTARPWMPWYIADFVGDTQHLDAAETGAYMLLLGHYWLSEGKLPEGDAAMARVARMKPAQWKASRDVLLKFFPEGCNKRSDKELAHAADVSKKRRASAKQKHSNSSANADANALQKDTHLQLQSQKKEDEAPDGAPAKIAFESGRIRLNAKNLDQWKSAFKNLDVEAELLGLSEWAEKQGNNWFSAVSGALAKRNRDVGLRKNAMQTGPAVSDFYTNPTGGSLI